MHIHILELALLNGKDIYCSEWTEGRFIQNSDNFFTVKEK